MRDAKDLTKNLTANMTYIFGVREDAYYLDLLPPLPSCVNTKRTNTLNNRGYYRGAVADQKERRRDKNSEYNDGSRHGATNKKKKKKCTSED